MEGSFHGRTMGALALTATARYREPFEPLPGEVVFVPFGDADALAAAVDDRTAAVVLETIQGESGVVCPPDGYLRRVREVTREHGCLLWVDEVQTGIGRCGQWLTSVADGLEPDLVTLAKASATASRSGPAWPRCGWRTAHPRQSWQHLRGQPDGGGRPGSPGVIESEGLLAHSRSMGDYLSWRVLAIGDGQVVGVRGRGCCSASSWRPTSHRRSPTPCWKPAGSPTPPPVGLRLAPPLIITTEVVDQFIGALAEVLAEVRQR